jgi:hypothetical protein
LGFAATAATGTVPAVSDVAATIAAAADVAAAPVRLLWELLLLSLVWLLLERLLCLEWLLLLRLQLIWLLLVRLLLRAHLLRRPITWLLLVRLLHVGRAAVD